MTSVQDEKALLVLNKWILGVAIASLLVQLAILAIAGFFLLATVFPANAADGGAGPTSSDCSVLPGMRPPGCPTSQ